MTPPAPPAVLIENLRFRWRGEDAFSLAIDQLAVAAGERVFIQGQSGSGKSTLLNLIAGVMRPDEGSVSLLGQRLGDLSAGRLDGFRADHIGFIFQQFNLIPYLSVLNNVLLPCQFSKVRAARAADPVAQARRLLAALEIDEPLHLRPAMALSVGQQQRVAAARALIGRPEILIAYEPTSALDAARQAGFLRLLLDEAQAAGAAVLFVSHDAALASQFDRTFELQS